MKKDNTSNTEETKKKKPFILRFFKSILIFLLILILLIAGWFAFCNFNKTSNLSALPQDYSLYVRTDCIWDAVNPMLDLKAADILLSEEPMLQFRQAFLSLRESDLRNNFFVSYALSRRIDAALYEDNSFIAIVDMGLLSGITRLSPVASRFISVPGLFYTIAGKDSCFEYRMEDMTIYAKTYKNLVIATNSKSVLHNAIIQNNEVLYSREELKLLQQPLDQPFRIAADGKKLISLLEEENPYIKAVTDYLSAEELSEIKFGITDENIDIAVKIPFEIADENKENPLLKLIQRDSQIPVLLSNLPETVQYYTFITAGKLSELKNAAFTVMADNPDLQKKWNDANNISKTVFKENLEEILFSWTSDEYAVLGIEGKSEPVFAIKIADEVKRKYIFDTILSSIVFKTDNSLLLDGVRLPRIEFPGFLQGLLEAFKINLPKPYYMVKDNFVYFSQSPENLACINAAIKNGSKLSKNENWQKVSQKHSSQSSLSLFYNLERSIPFFLKNKSKVTEILQLYNIGRVDLRTEKNTIYISLQANANPSKSTKYIPGFPITFEQKVAPVLYKSQNERSHLLFWMEPNKAVKSINTLTLEINEKEINELSFIKENTLTTDSGKDTEIWAVTKEGNVYLLNEKLETKDNFPVITSEKPTCEPAIYKNNLVYFAEDGMMLLVTPEGIVTKTTIDLLNDIISVPAIYKNTIAIYEKGFLGTIHLITDNREEDSLDVNGIAFGSPCISEIEGKPYTAFITQSGSLNVWNEENEMLPNFPVSLPGIFYLNVKATEKYIIALASDGTIYKVDLEGNYTQVKIPYLSAKSGYITICDYNDDGISEIFVCGEANVIYGFNQNLEYLNGFPVTGYGVPVFTDINGDKQSDCLTLTIDNKLNAWKVN